ncbi:MAG: oligosaccharide flippase family protein [Bacteroidota bacterium]
MLTDIKRAFGKSAVYSLGNMGTKLIGLVLIPLYTNQTYLSVSVYGALGVLEITSQVLVALMSLTLSQSLTRWFWDKDYVARQKSIFFTSLITLIIISAIMLIAAIPFSGSISSLLFNHTNYSYLIKLLLINSALQILITQVQTLLKLQSKALYYSIVSILKLSITLVLTIYFIVYRGKKLDGIFEAQFIGSTLVLLLLLPYCIKNSKLRFEGRIMLEMMNYSLPLMLASISGVFFSVIDRYSLNYMDGLERVGIYNLGYKIASTLKVVIITSVQLALSPILMKKINDPDNKRFYSRVMTYFGFGLMFCVIGLSLFSLEVIKVASRDIIYWESANIVAILAFSFFFSMLKDSAFIGLHVVKKTRISGGLIAISSVINLGLNILLIPRFSIYGAAVGTLLSQVIFFTMIYTAAQKWYRIPYELSRVFRIVGVGIVLVAAGFFLNGIPIGIRLIIKTVLLLSFPFVLYFFRFYNEIELESIRRIFSIWKNPNKLISNLKRLLLNK